MSFPGRVAGVFVSPGELFEGLRERPAWFGVLALGAVMVGASLAAIPPEVWAQAMREQIVERGGTLPGDLGAGLAVMRIGSVVGGVVFYFLWAFLLAGIATLVFAFVLGDEGRYAQYLAVVSHAFLITGAGAILTLPLKIAQEDPSLTLSLGTFAFFLEKGYLFRVLNLLDLFALWGYGVMAVGVSKVDPRRGFGSAAAFFYGFALLFALGFGLIPR